MPTDRRGGVSYRALTDKAALVKASLSDSLSSGVGWQLMGIAREDHNGWWAEKYPEYAKWTRAMFNTLPCVAAIAEASLLLTHSANSLPGDIPVFEIRPEMSSGFLYLERPVLSGEDPVQAYVWLTDYIRDPENPFPGRPTHDSPLGLTIGTLGPDGSFGVKNWPVEGGRTLDWMESHIEDSTVVGAMFDLRLVIAFNLLLAQGVTETEEWQPTRQIRRHATRHGHVLNPVTIVRLPRRHYEHAQNGESHVDWSHRWVVSGHWRKQWYAKQEVHRPKWIAPYVKGPDDKPLLVKEKRYVFDPRL